MFKSSIFGNARIKLTAWYLLIITLISVCFSVTIYEMFTSELDRVERVQRLRIERGLPDDPSRIVPPDLRADLPRFTLDPELVTETKNRVAIILTITDLVILGISSVAGFFLAGRTLKPIKEMVEEQNRFITDASHELRTPLTSLKSEIEVSLRDKNLTLAQTKKLLRSNLEDVNNLQVLSDDLIKLTQYQKTTNGFTFSNLSLVPIFDEAIRKIKKLAKTKKISIINKINNFSLQGNRQTLVELFVIFLDNAIKYSPQNTKVTLTSKKTDGYIKIEIADQGVGIDQRDIPHLFDRFYRASKSRAKTEVQGYGLGLSIAKEIVDKHQGHIKVQSKLKKGTIFTILLPAKRSHKLI